MLGTSSKIPWLCNVSGAALVHQRDQYTLADSGACPEPLGAFRRWQRPTIMWAKFQALVEGARLTIRHLWGCQKVVKTILMDVLLDSNPLDPIIAPITTGA
jgi:hypothetical protein